MHHDGAACSHLYAACAVGAFGRLAALSSPRAADQNLLTQPVLSTAASSSRRSTQPGPRAGYDLVRTGYAKHQVPAGHQKRELPNADCVTARLEKMRHLSIITVQLFVKCCSRNG